MNARFRQRVRQRGIILPIWVACLSLYLPSGVQVFAQGGSTSDASSGSAPASASNASIPAAKGADPRAGFVIGSEDVLAVQVWKEPDVSRTLPVRSDGKISLPLAGELQAAGRTPAQLEADIAASLRTYITDPRVTVIVQEIHSQKFNILGQVVRPGAYALTRPTTVVDAIALAGGFRDFAKQKSIYILRQDGSGNERRVRFNYKAVIQGRAPKQNLQLQAGDTVVVP